MVALFLESQDTTYMGSPLSRVHATFNNEATIVFGMEQLPTKGATGHLKRSSKFIHSDSS